MAPEVFNARSDDPDYSYNELSDMWSVGVIAYMLCTNTDPFVKVKVDGEDSL